VIEAWQFSLSGNSGTRSEKKSLFCGAQKRQNPPAWSPGKSSLTISAKPVGVGAWVSTINSNGQTVFVADAHRDDGRRFIVNADEKLSAFLELERQVTVTFYLESVNGDSCQWPMTVIEIRPHRWSWNAFEAPGVE
jgi:hypothetical protein